MPIEIVDKDLGFKRIVRSVRETNKSYVEIGYQGDEKEKDSDIRVVDVAVFNEFGTSNIPSRAFIRTAFDRVQNKLNTAIAKLYDGVLKGEIGTEKALKSIGLYMKAAIVKQINMTLEPPNAPSTIDRKKSTHPLIDTGQMRQSVSYTTHFLGQDRTYEKEQ